MEQQLVKWVFKNPVKLSNFEGFYFYNEINNREYQTNLKENYSI